MFALRVVHQRDGRLGHGGQCSDFTRVVHAQLNHGHLMVSAQTQQGQRHTNVVVEITLRREIGPGFEGRQNGRHHLRDGGFTVAPRHGDQWQGELRPPSGSELTQRGFGIGHHQPWQTGGEQRRVSVALTQCRHRTARFGFRHKCVRVKTLTTQGHEKIARLNRARVGVNPANHHRTASEVIGNQPRPTQPISHLLQRHHVSHGVAPG